jgi:hypothetical protein
MRQIEFKVVEVDPPGLEELRVTERQLDQFTDLSHLLAASTNIIVANFVYEVV